MTKAELLTKVSEKVGQKIDNVSKKQITETVDALFDTLKEVLCSEDEAASRFSYPGFGTFTVKQRAARMGHNPHTKEVIEIKASKAVSFKAAAALKDAINGTEKAEKCEEAKAEAKKADKKADKKPAKKCKK